jgi:hypothetical protein
VDAIFDDKERRVFQYHNGTAVVFGDPWLIYRRLLAAFDGDLKPALDQLHSKEPGVWVPAVERLVPVVRDIFGMVPFDSATGAGATDDECVQALHAFLGWLAEKKAPAAS